MHCLKTLDRAEFDVKVGDWNWNYRSETSVPKGKSSEVKYENTKKGKDWKQENEKRN